jgi:predicted nucleotidyltransferase component of viral defense system
VRASITDRLNRYATDHGQSIALVRRRFVIARFLTRVFDADPDGWILKGGISMMVRLPQARYSKDIDLHTATDLPESVDELRRTVRDHHLDHFRFEVGPSTELSHDKGVTVTVTASLGGKTYDSFSLDLVGARRTLVGEIERRPIPRLVDTDDFPPETSVPLYPLADQIADKICALYEVHGAAGAASGRFRDLVDLLLISMFLPIDLTSTVDAVERERRVRGLPALPATLVSPGPAWATQWGKAARNSPLTADLHDFESALAAAGRCYDRILGSLPAAGRAAFWHHERGVWENGSKETAGQ